MFGASSFGGFGQQNQQGVNNASQPATGGLFGQPAATTGAAGTGSGAFGAPAFGQPAQTGATPAFGATTQTPAFGTTASAQQPQVTPFSFNQSSTSTFGAPKPATTGFGSFGASAQPSTTFGFGAASTPVQQPQQPGTSAFGSVQPGSAFGQNNTTTSFFGQQPAAMQPSTFGAFGSGMPAHQAITQGSATVPYTPFREDMTPNEPKAHAKTFEVHQSLTSMPAYQNISPEELRLMDYQQGRGKGTAGPNPSSLGASTTAPTTTPAFGFGSQSSMGTNAFGQPQAQTTPAFGQASGTGLFGQQNNNQMGSTSLFGASNTGGSSGLFGANANKPSAFGSSTSTPLFGQNNQTSGTGGGLFGNSSMTQPATGGGFMFGANNNQASTQPSTGFSFGTANNQAQNTQPKPLFGGFGSTSTPQQPSQPSTGFSFGSTSTSQPGATNAFGTGGGFSFGSANANNASTQPKPGGGLFGSSATTQPSTTFGSFGAAGNNAATSAQQNKPAFSFGSFGSNPNNTSSTQPSATTGFGAPASTTGGGGLFGAKPPTSTGTGFSFGQPNASAQQPGTTGFGSAATNTGTSGGIGGGLFGAKPAGTSLFGNPASSATQPNASTGGTSSLFGGQTSTQPPASQPSGGGLFGSSAPKPTFSFGSAGSSGTGLGTGAGAGTGTGAGSGTGFSFGSGSGAGAAGSAPSTTGGGAGGGLFGQSQPAPSSTGPSLFGQSQPAVPSANTGSSLFGGAKPLGASMPTMTGASAQPLQPPSLTTNPYGTDALLANVAGAPAASQSPLPFNVAPKNKPPLVSPFRSSPRNAVRVTRLRGSTPGLDMSRSIREGTPSDRATPVRAGSVGLFRQPSDAVALSPQAFIPRSTSKRLVLDGDTSLSRSPSMLREGTPRASVPPRARFSPAVEKVLSGSGGAFGGDSIAGGAGTGNTSSLSGTGAEADSSLVLPVREPSYTASPAPRGKSARPLQHGDYYTEPSLPALRSMRFDDLSHVEHFVVGRIGFGRLAFLKHVDLTTVPNLSFIAGGVVQLRTKECFVYPQEEDLESDVPLDGLLPNYVPVPKAPLGTGLNVPARVSLEGCWPVDRATREPLRDESHPRVKQHINKLRNKKETDFVSYDALTGTWTFEVQHFSRYGLDESDEDDDDADVDMPAHTRVGMRDADNVDDEDEPPPMKLGEESDDSGSSAMRESELMSGDEDEDEQPMTDYDVWVPTIRDEPVPALARRSMTPAAASRLTPGVPDARKVQVMRASFFGQAPPTPGPVGGVKLSGPSAQLPLRHTSQLMQGRTSANVSNDDGVNADVDEAQEPVAAAAAVTDAGPADVTDMPPIEEPPVHDRVPVARVESSLSALDTSLCADPGLFLSRSFRIGWACRGAVLAHNGTLHGLACPGWTQVYLDRMRVYKNEAEQAASLSTARKLLELQLASTHIEPSNEGGSIPRVSFQPNTTCASIAKHYAPDDKQYAAQLWHLASVLFDPVDLKLPNDASDAWHEHVLQRRRKTAFSSWLERVVSAPVQADVRAHIAASRRTDLVFALLTGHQVEHAAEAALEAGHVRLATLVAQAGGSLDVRADIQEQLDTWHAEGVDADIDHAMLRVYALLAGQVVSAQVSGARARDARTIAMARGLDWRRALGLHVWYGTPWESPLEASVRSYEAAVHAPSETVPPLPTYQAEAQLGALKQRELIQQAGAPRDALFELLKLHVDATYPLEHALDARNFGKSALDHTLPWHVCMYLSRALRVRTCMDPHVEDRLTSLYAAQLEETGEWHWAVFVLLHLLHDQVRAQAVQALLARHVDVLDAHSAFLTTTLHVDETWLWQARALAAHARSDYFAEYECRRHARDLSGAHAVAVRHLAAESFLRGDTQLLVDLFRPIADEAEASSAVPIKGWNEGGRVLLDYATLPQILPPLLAKAHTGSLEASERHALQQATVRTHELMDRVPLLYADTTDLMSTVARSEMLAVLQNFTRLLASEAGAPEPVRHWTAANPPEVEQLQAAARDFTSSMLACL